MRELVSFISIFSSDHELKGVRTFVKCVEHLFLSDGSTTMKLLLDEGLIVQANIAVEERKL